MLPRRTFTVVAAVAASTLLWAGCGGGGSSKVSASTYVKTVCTAIGGYLTSIKNRESAVKSAGTPSSPAQGRQILQTFTNGMVQDTGSALSQLKSAGTPDVSNGSQIASAIVNVFTQVRTALSKAQAQANQLPVTNATAFKSAVTQYVSTFQASLANVAGGLSGLRSPALVSAANKVPACQSLNSA